MEIETADELVEVTGPATVNVRYLLEEESLIRQGQAVREEPFTPGFLVPTTRWEELTLTVDADSRVRRIRTARSGLDMTPVSTTSWSAGEGEALYTDLASGGQSRFRVPPRAQSLREILDDLVGPLTSPHPGTSPGQAWTRGRALQERTLNPMGPIEHRVVETVRPDDGVVTLRRSKFTVTCSFEA